LATLRGARKLFLGWVSKATRYCVADFVADASSLLGAALVPDLLHPAVFGQRVFSTHPPLYSAAMVCSIMATERIFSSLAWLSGVAFLTAFRTSESLAVPSRYPSGVGNISFCTSIKPKALTSPSHNLVAECAAALSRNDVFVGCP